MADIVLIKEEDLEITLWSAWRLPGLALFTVRYAGIGKVRMCAKRASENILVIETRSAGFFGLTPADPAALLTEINKRLASAH